MAMIPEMETSIVLSSDGDALDNLVHSLAAELVLVRDLSQAQAIAAKLRNFIVAIVLRRGSRLERAPVPLVDHRQCVDAILRELIVLFALAHIAHPGAEIDLGSLEYFNVVCGY